MGKNVAVFVDVANIFYAAKAAGVDIDYVTLLQASSAGRDLVRAYAYTGLDPDNENQRNFHDFLRRHGYKVVSKDIRKYGDGKVKANLDIELVVDMMKTARNLDIAIVVSGDGDFAPAIRAVQEQGVRVEVVSFRGNTSSDLMDVADQFTDITHIAKVEKGSSRSGRRVATDNEDLSMTEVPDKQSEGTGERGRGRGRTRRVAGTTTTTRGRSRSVAATAAPEAGDAPIVVLPGEKLSRAASAPAPLADLIDEDLDAEELDGEAGEAGDESALAGGENGTGEDGRRRRRRRGGRGRGRGRGRDEGTFVEGEESPAAAGSADADGDADDEDDDADEAPTPARRAPSTFGSVWDSQIGVPASRGAPLEPDEDDLDEPAVPEYLIAERRRNAGGRGGARGGGAGGRGRGGAYAAALDRERFGGGRGSTPSRFGEPPLRREGAFGRPDREGPRDARPPRDDRPPRGGDRGDRRPPFRDVPRPAPRPSGDEPWSEVPPEIEAMLRAQLASRPAAEPRRDAPAPTVATGPAIDDAETDEPVASAPSGGRTGRRSTRATSDAKGTTATRGRARRASADADAVTADAVEADAAPAKPARRTTRRSTAATPRVEADAASALPVSEPAAEATTSSTGRRTTRSRTSKAATGAAATDSSDATAGDTAAEAPKRRTTRRKAEPAA